jgi:hypothetical protein
MAARQRNDEAHETGRGNGRRQQDHGPPPPFAASPEVIVRLPCRAPAGNVALIAQDRLMQISEPPARLDAELLGERPPGRCVSIQRFRLAPGARKREHQLATEPLAQRMLGDQDAQPRHELRVAPQRELRLDAFFLRAGAKLLQLGPRRPRERRVRDVGQRRRPAQVDRLVDRDQRRAGVARGELGTRALQQVLEAHHIDRIALDLQHVARRPRRDVPAERAAQVGDVPMQRSQRRLRRLFAPHPRRSAGRPPPRARRRAPAWPAPLAAAARRR